MTDINQDQYQNLLNKISDNKHVYTFGVSGDCKNVHYHIARLIDNLPVDYIELVPYKNKHVIKLHTENFDTNSLSGLEAGQLSALLQLASMLILNIDYGIAPKTK